MPCAGRAQIFVSSARVRGGAGRSTPTPERPHVRPYPERLAHRSYATATHNAHDVVVEISTRLAEGLRSLYQRPQSTVPFTSSPRVYLTRPIQQLLPQILASCSRSPAIFFILSGQGDFYRYANTPLPRIATPYVCYIFQAASTSTRCAPSPPPTSSKSG